MKFENKIYHFETQIKKIEKLLFLSNFFKSKKIILYTLEEITKISNILFNLILQYNHAKGIIKVSKNTKKNKEILFEIIGKKWKIKKQLKKLSKLTELNKKHFDSSMEFLRKDKIIIIDKNQKINQINNEDLKQFLNLIKEIKEVFNQKIRE